MLKIFLSIVILMGAYSPECSTPTSSSDDYDDTPSYYEPPDPPFFYGRVIDNVSNKFVERATVCIKATSNCTSSRHNRYDNRYLGYYELEPVEQGQYTIIATHPDYKPDTTVATLGSRPTIHNIHLKPLGS